jgi:hypothetical protein
LVKKKKKKKKKILFKRKVNEEKEMYERGFVDELKEINKRD